MRVPTVKCSHISFASLLVGCLLLQQPVSAQPFGKGLFGADVPFGDMTSIGVSVGSSAAMALTPSGGIFSGSASHVVTVTSTDVVGYKLYLNADTSTAMTNGTDSIAASANNSAASLSTNSWGYNTSGSTTQFKGVTLLQAQINAQTGPYKNGDDTTVTYGALADSTKSSGVYTVDLTYTAIGDS